MATGVSCIFWDKSSPFILNCSSRFPGMLREAEKFPV